MTFDMKAREITGKTVAALGFAGLFGMAGSIGTQILWTGGCFLLMLGGALLAGINPFREDGEPQ